MYLKYISLLFRNVYRYINNLNKSLNYNLYNLCNNLYRLIFEARYMYSILQNKVFQNKIYRRLCSRRETLINGILKSFHLSSIK